MYNNAVAESSVTPIDRNEHQMTKVIGGSVYRPEEQATEVSAHFVYTIRLSGKPKLMAQCRAFIGIYAHQIEFELDAAGDPDADESYVLNIPLYCGRINPTYRQALNSLFGTKIGDILSMKGELYAAGIAAADAAHIPGKAAHIGSLGAIERLLDVHMSDLIAKQAYNRLMVNPSFP